MTIKDNLLTDWLNFKNLENYAKEKRVALEEEVYKEYSNQVLKDGKLSGTLNLEDFKLTIKLNPKWKVTDESLIPEDADIYKTVVDEKKLQQYENEEWVEKVQNKPTITVVRTK